MLTNNNKDELICSYIVTAKMKQVFSVQLDLLRVFKNLCEKHGLTYYILFGTLLGAVRHQGFIPWDDDVDVAMPREDYGRFIELAANELAEPYVLQTKENEHDFFHGSICRMRNSCTTALVRDELGMRLNQGIWIDILPLDAVPSDPQRWAKQRRRVGFYHRLLLLKTYGSKKCTIYGKKFSMSSTPFFNILRMIKPSQRCFYLLGAKLFSRSWLNRQFDAACTRWNRRDEDCFTCFGSCIDSAFNETHLLLREDFRQSVMLPFEDLLLSAPAGYARCLCRQMGSDYMIFPEYEKRHPRHGAVYDPQRPYLHYRNKFFNTFEGAEHESIVLFGAGNMLEHYIRHFGKSYPPVLAVDNDPSKWGTVRHKIPVAAPDKIFDVKGTVRVIICNIYYSQIARQLEEMGITNYYLYLEQADYLWEGCRQMLGENLYLPQKIIPLMAMTGARTNLLSGRIETCPPDRMATLPLYRAGKKSLLHLLSADYEFAVATYSPCVDETYLYTYAYQEEENWTIYNQDLTPGSYRQADYHFTDECYFRVCVRRADGASITALEAEHINQILLYITFETNYQLKPYFDLEVRRVADQVNCKSVGKRLVMAVLTDTHYTINGTWEDTAFNINALCQKIRLNGIVHLGDLTDGMLPRDVTCLYASQVLGDLTKTGVPVYTVVGNHDTNYFRNNPDRLTQEEQYRLYQRHLDDCVNRKGEVPYYYTDFKEIGIRGIFLSSFDYNEPVRYGYSKEELEWISHTLEETPSHYKVLLFSHETLLPALDYWTDQVRGGEQLLKMLEEYNARHGKKVLAFIHGHTHADAVCRVKGIPIISIGCAKCEYFTDKKPEGSVTPKRRLGTPSQELWDVMIVDPATNTIEFVRFGAGQDRTVIC